MSVSQEVNLSAINVMDDLFDTTNVVTLIQIDPLSSIHVEIDTVLGCGNNGDRLILGHQEEFWLHC
jgi:hypothetical protein